MKCHNIMFICLALALLAICIISKKSTEGLRNAHFPLRSGFTLFPSNIYGRSASAIRSQMNKLRQNDMPYYSFSPASRGIDDDILTVASALYFTADGKARVYPAGGQPAGNRFLTMNRLDNNLVFFSVLGEPQYRAEIDESSGDLKISTNTNLKWNNLFRLVPVDGAYKVYNFVTASEASVPPAFRHRYLSYKAQGGEAPWGKVETHRNMALQFIFREHMHGVYYAGNMCVQSNNANTKITSNTSLADSFLMNGRVVDCSTQASRRGGNQVRPACDPNDETWANAIANSANPKHTTPSHIQSLRQLVMSEPCENREARHDDLVNDTEHCTSFFADEAYQLYHDETKRDAAYEKIVQVPCGMREAEFEKLRSKVPTQTCDDGGVIGVSSDTSGRSIAAEFCSCNGEQYVSNNEFPITFTSHTNKMQCAPITSKTTQSTSTPLSQCVFENGTPEYNYGACNSYVRTDSDHIIPEFSCYNPNQSIPNITKSYNRNEHRSRQSLGCNVDMRVENELAKSCAADDRPGNKFDKGACPPSCTPVQVNIGYDEPKFDELPIVDTNNQFGASLKDRKMCHSTKTYTLDPKHQECIKGNMFRQGIKTDDNGQPFLYTSNGTDILSEGLNSPQMYLELGKLATESEADRADRIRNDLYSIDLESDSGTHVLRFREDPSPGSNPSPNIREITVFTGGEESRCGPTQDFTWDKGNLDQMCTTLDIDQNNDSILGEMPQDQCNAYRLSDGRYKIHPHGIVLPNRNRPAQ